jgi:hypothetical protein
MQNRSDGSPNWINKTKPISTFAFRVCESCSDEGVNDRNAGSGTPDANRTRTPLTQAREEDAKKKS